MYLFISPTCTFTLSAYMWVCCSCTQLMWLQFIMMLRLCVQVTQTHILHMFVGDIEISLEGLWAKVRKGWNSYICYYCCTLYYYMIAVFNLFINWCKQLMSKSIAFIVVYIVWTWRDVCVCVECTTSTKMHRCRWIVRIFDKQVTRSTDCIHSLTRASTHTSIRDLQSDNE